MILISVVFSQTLELRGYLKSLGAEISEENADSGILTDLKNIIEASSICWKELSSDSGNCLHIEMYSIVVIH